MTLSIILPVHNAEPYLAATIQSVRAQTYTDWELLAVDDASSDQSRAILHDLAAQDPRIRVLGHATNAGAAASRNTGIDAARGTHFAFIDADDLWRPDKLARQLVFMQDSGAGFSCTAYRVVSVDGSPRTIRHVPPCVDQRALLLHNTIGTSTVIVSRDVLGAERFPALMRRQDYAMWLRLLGRGGTCEGLDAPLTHYRRRPGSLSASKLQAALSTWAVYSSVPGLTRRRAVWSYGNYLVRTTLKHVL